MERISVSDGLCDKVHNLWVTKCSPEMLQVAWMGQLQSPSFDSWKPLAEDGRIAKSKKCEIKLQDRDQQWKA